MILKKFLQTKKSNVNNSKGSKNVEVLIKEESLWQIKEVICSTSKYKIIETVINTLQNNGFLLQNIRTSGQCSGHDCIDGFNHEYKSFTDFMGNVREDFLKRKECVKDFAELNWSCTHFQLFEEIHNLYADITIDENNGATSPSASIICFRKDTVSEQDKMFLDQLLLDLEPFIKK